MYQDKTLTCIDCGADFTFTTDEQEFYATHQLTNEPKRCKPCREKRKTLNRGGGGPRQRPGGGFRGGPPRDAQGGGGAYHSRSAMPRTRYKIVCNACGKEDMVPFEPKEGREIFCHSCYAERRK